MSPASFFAILLRASLFSTGGMGNLPAVHSDLTARGWATDRDFAESLAVGNLAPGPNGLWVVTLGYLIDGLRGAMLASAAIVLPPFLVLAVERLYLRGQRHPAVEGFVSGLGLAVTGIAAAILGGLLRSIGPGPASGVIVAAAALAASRRRIPPLLILGAGALAGTLMT